MIPEFLDEPTVLGIGEIGLNKNTRNEATVFLDHLDLAARNRNWFWFIRLTWPTSTRARE